MINRTIRLQLGDERVKALKEYNRKVMRHLEKKLPLNAAVLEDLKDALSAVVEDSIEWAEVLRGIRDSGDYYCVHLLHPDNEILNLPWSMAVDEPLLRAGLVEIDFTEDGSLEALERKLTSNRFHVLHFFGHGIYDEDEQKGFLQLEEPESLRTELAEDREFAGVVNCNPDYRVPLVVLASCQTAKGGSDKALSGVTNHLLRIGVPVVVSMGMSIFDHYAADNYELALEFFHKSLKGYQKVGDKQGEGATLNNVSQIYKARGDLDNALNYLEQSLKIRGEIGDKSGSGHTLHNMAAIAYAKKDVEKVLEYETASYKIAIEINDAMGIYNVGMHLGYILCQRGQKEEGIEMLKRSLAIGKAAGFADVGEIEKILQGLESGP